MKREFAGDVSFAPLPESFYEPNAEAVAPALLGHWLIRKTEAGFSGGLIVETRVFKAHPTLARAELSYGKGERVLKITMRDGRTVSVSGDKVKGLRDVKASQLVVMASK